MKIANSISSIVLAFVISQSAATQEETAEQKADRIQAEIEAIELERHRLLTEEKLIEVRKRVVAKRLELQSKERELAEGGTQKVEVNKPIETKPVKPPFSWGDLPELRSLGEDTSGKKASVLLASGQTAILRIGMKLPSGASVKEITNTGILLEKQGRERWVR